MTTGKIVKGTQVRYTTGNLGTTSGEFATRVTEHVVGVGDTGVYLRPCRDLGEPGWHTTTVQHDGTTLYCVVHESMFEVDQ